MVTPIYRNTFLTYTAVATAKEAAEMEKNAPAAMKNAVNDAANKALKGIGL